jgi:hypothetical protein
MGGEQSQERLLSSPTQSRPPGDSDVTDLKLETIAQFDRDGNRMAGSSRQHEEEMEYVVHRDAGRVRELPPRYEELKWEEAERRE